MYVKICSHEHTCTYMRTWLYICANIDAHIYIHICISMFVKVPCTCVSYNSATGKSRPCSSMFLIGGSQMVYANTAYGSQPPSW